MKDLREGIIVDGVKLLNLLGSGKSGEVWSALSGDGKVVALKIYRSKHEVREFAEYEYRMANLFRHVNILSPTGISSHDEHPVICLPYCEGRSVDGIAGHISERMLWKLITEISGALAEIHDNGYGHFDIKPSNILWDGEKFMLSDFGACMKTGESCSVEDTAEDASSYRFDAPELGTQHCVASDIWSLGATVFYLCMGCHAFNGLGGRAQHKDSPVPVMRKALPALSTLVQSCLDFNPANRPTAKQVCEIANAELNRLESYVPKRILKHKASGLAEASGDTEFWPEQMIE